jgi:hypothetical protein
MIQDIEFILIIGAVLCVFLGILMTSIRYVKIIRRERAMADKIRMYLQSIEEATYQANIKREKIDSPERN